MKIRAKLTLLILGIAALFALASFIYFMLLGPVEKMDREKSYFSNLADAIRLQQVRLNRLPFAPILQARQAYGEASSGVDAAFEELAKVQVLPTVNSDLKEAAEIIQALKELLDSRARQLQDDYEALMAKEEEIFYSVKAISLLHTYTYDFPPEKRAGVAAAMASLDAFIADIENMNTTIDIAEDTIAEQFSIIDQEISAVRARALAIAMVIVALVIGITLFFSILFANGVARSIVRIERNIVMLKEGDLTERADISSKDEIGSLSRDLNLFLDALSASILNIKAISTSNIDSKNRLIDAATEATSSTTQIGANTSSIGGMIRNLDERISESSGSIGKIVASISELDAQIEGQSAMVEEATASVTEMLASLENMSRTTEKNRASAEDLVAVAGRGRSVFETASSKIGEIPRSVGAIREMAKVIRGLASQTNLLAMNAAIEAAHAGESGRGFSVVADEIRSLSEASTKSSRDIAESIKVIVSKIDEATAANAGTTGAFAAIDDRIREVAKSMAEINASIGEIRTGSRQILEAMTDLQDRSLSVKAGSKLMEEGSSEIASTMRDVDRISSEVTSNINEIALGIGQIGGSIRAVGALAEDVGSGSARLDAEVSRFKTKAVG